MNKNIVMKIMSIGVLLFIVQISFAQTKLEQAEKSLKEEIIKIQNITEEKSVFDSKVKTLQEEIALLDNDINGSEIELSKTISSVQSIQIELEETKEYISYLEKMVNSKKILMKEYISSLYYQPEINLFQVFLTNRNLSEILGSIKQSSAMQDFITESIKTIEIKEKEIFLEKDHLFKKEEELILLRDLQEDQKKFLELAKLDKQTLLDQTQGEQKKYEELLKVSFEQRKTILNTINLLGGGKNNALSLEEAYNLAKINATLLENKVRPEFLVGVMKVESGLGRNTGGSFYKDALSGCAAKEGNNTRINVLREEAAFESIVAKLGIPITQPVSTCPFREGSSYKAGTGGAMGQAQVMPTTWLGYEKKLETIKGAPVNPWKIEDAMLAVGNILIGKVGNQSINGNIELERKAAMCYVGGCNQSWYADRVMNAVAQVELALNLNQPEIVVEENQEIINQ